MCIHKNFKTNKLVETWEYLQMKFGANASTIITQIQKHNTILCKIDNSIQINFAYGP